MVCTERTWHRPWDPQSTSCEAAGHCTKGTKRGTSTQHPTHTGSLTRPDLDSQSKPPHDRFPVRRPGPGALVACHLPTLSKHGGGGPSGPLGASFAAPSPHRGTVQVGFAVLQRHRDRTARATWNSGGHFRAGMKVPITRNQGLPFLLFATLTETLSLRLLTVTPWV